VENLDITIDDLKQIGFVSGVFLDDVLKNLKFAVAHQPELNNRDILIEMARQDFDNYEGLYSLKN